MVSKFSADVEVNIDKLGFDDYAEGVVATLEDLPDEQTPFTLGIFGSWGSGKTSFMKIMQGKMDARGYKTIFFNSWEYGNEEKPWIPFMIKIVDELFEDEIDKKNLIRDIFLFSTDMVLQKYTEGMISAGGILGWVKGIKKTTPYKEWSDDDINLVIERVTKIEKFKRAVAERAKELSKESSKSLTLKKIIAFIKSIPKKIKIFLTKVWRRGKTLPDAPQRIITKNKIIIFIDDLDRIQDSSIDFLNSLKIFLNIPGCVFIIGCDKNILECALKGRYEKDAEKEIYKNYFDKIVQTEFYMPGISTRTIRDYLKLLLTGFDDHDIKECTQMVTNSIGGNPRKIKRVVNATILIRRVFEKKIASFLKAFENPKTKMEGEKIEQENERPSALKIEITRIFSPEEVFDILFKNELLFMLVCIREQWPGIYKRLLVEDEIQNALVSEEISELLNRNGEDGGTIVNLTKFIESSKFQGVEDLKTYLTLLEISSPEARMIEESKNPETLTDNLFNRYMIFKRINKGKVEEEDIKKRIEHMKWDDNLSSYYFFASIITTFGYSDLLVCLNDNLIKYISKEDKNFTQFENKINDCNDPGAIGWLLGSVKQIDERKAITLLRETKDAYAGKIRNSNSPGAIGTLLYILKVIDRGAAMTILSKTKDAYSEKIIACNNPLSIRALLFSLKEIDERTAKKILGENKDAYAKKIRDSSDLVMIITLLVSVKEIDDRTAKKILCETKDVYAEKIRDSNDLWAIENLLNIVKVINEGTPRKLLDETKDAYSKKIRNSNDIEEMENLLKSMIKIDERTAKTLLCETKDVCAEKIRNINDLKAIENLFNIVKVIDERTTRELLSETKDAYAKKIKNSNDLEEMESLLKSMIKIDEGNAGELLSETKDAYAEKIRDSNDLKGIGMLLGSLKEIEPKKAKALLNQTKEIYAEKIGKSNDLWEIRILLNGVKEINIEETEALLNQTKDTYAEKIRASNDLKGIGLLLRSLKLIDESIAKKLHTETKDAYSGKIDDSNDIWAIGNLLNFVKEINDGTAETLLSETKECYAKKIRDSNDLIGIGTLLHSVKKIDEMIAQKLHTETKDVFAGKIENSNDLLAIRNLLDAVKEIDPETAIALLRETQDSIQEKIRDSKDQWEIGSLLNSFKEIDRNIARQLERNRIPMSGSINIYE